MTFFFDAHAASSGVFGCEACASGTELIAGGPKQGGRDGRGGGDSRDGRDSGGGSKNGGHPPPWRTDDDQRFAVGDASQLPAVARFEGLI